MATGIHSTFTSTTEFVHCCEILLKERDYSMVSSLEEETATLLEQSLPQKAALREILDTFNLPENAARLEDARISAGNDMLKSMQHVFPAATQMQVQVIHRYGFLPDGEGLVQFTKAVRLYEEHDQEVRQLNEQLRSVLIPPVNVPYPVSPIASQNGVS